MASLTGAPPTTNGQGRKPVAPPKPLTATRLAGRNRARVAGGAVLLGLSALVAVALYGSVGDRVPVLAVARQVEAGQTIANADLTVVRVAAEPGVRTIPAADKAQVVGRTASVALTPGALLATGQVGDGLPLPQGSIVVGAVLEPGHFPLGLRTGDAVQLVPLPAAGTDIVKGMGSVPAVVAAVERLPDRGGVTALSLAVAPEMASDVAVAGADGRLSVMRQLP